MPGQQYLVAIVLRYDRFAAAKGKAFFVLESMLT
jgi:hypothetical protein